MRYVRVERADHGFTVDHRDYLDWLTEHADSLPSGAKAFALHQEHYDATRERCPSGAMFGRMSTRETGGIVDVTLVLTGRGDAAPELILRYTDVTQLTFANRPPGPCEPGLLADEILPHGDGVSHELRFPDTDITVIAADLTAGWPGRGRSKAPADPLGQRDHDDPATRVHHMRTRPGLCFLDDRYLTAASTIRWNRHLWPDDESHGRFQDYVSTRLTGGPCAVAWEGLVLRRAAGDTPGRELTDEQHTAARDLMFDLLEDYFAEQGHTAG